MISVLKNKEDVLGSVKMRWEVDKLGTRCVCSGMALQKEIGLVGG